MISCPLLYSWCTFLALVGTAERIHLQGLTQRSHQIKPGDSVQDVLRILGEPDERWEERVLSWSLLFGYRPRRWIYGTNIDPSFIVVRGLWIPNPVPISIRWFDAEDADLVINWKANGTVSKVIRPDLNVPPSVQPSVDFALFLTTVFNHFKGRSTQ
jgi:hypothetical protein